MISKEQKFIEEDLERLVPKIGNKLDKLKHKSILITGATGFLGTWLLQLIHFLNKNYKMNINLFALDRDFYNLKEKYSYLLNSKNITIIESDVRSAISLSNEVDYIIHAASTPDRRMHSSSPLDTMTSIAEGTSSLLKLSSRLPNLKMFLNMSASSVYDQGNEDSIKETSSGKPLSQNISYAHAEAKRFAEALCSAARSEARIPITTLRPFTFCGPYQDINAPWALNSFISDVLNNNSINISGNGKAKRSYMYGLDFAVWSLIILINTKSGEIYNIGSNQGISLKKLAKEILKVANLNEEIELNTSLLDQIKQDSLVPNTDAAMNDFGLELFTDFDKTIKRTFDWYKLLSNNE
jgi:nucleoside-diphosphate-sugar epimerase